MRCGEARAGIAHGDFNLRLIAAEVDVDRTAMAVVFECIRQQVDHDLPQARAVATDPCTISRTRIVKGDIARGRLRHAERDALLDQVVDIERFR